jgi:multimeric flavodoxin WrbA
LFINATLKISPEPSHTAALMQMSREIIQTQCLSVERIRASEHVLASAAQPDMTQHGIKEDDWPATFAEVAHAGILVIGTPIWLGERSSVCSSVIERLYAQLAQRPGSSVPTRGVNRERW